MLNIIKNTALVAVVGLGLGACANMYDTAKNTAPAGDAYNKALFSELMALADFERKEEDWTDANYFGGMAVAAASGETVALTDPNARRLNRYKNSGYTREDVVAAHNAVSGVMADGGASRDPAAMAKAVAGYECMYEQIEEGHQAADIKRCKEMLDGALASLAVRPVMEPGVCYYPIGGYAVDFDCQKAISAIADAAANGGQVVIQGHADTLGPADFNLELSKRRAQGVVEVLTQLGIPEDRMTVGAVGQTNLRVETPDETAEQQNRVVVMRVVN
jgi:OOP family OmpA-OmpF porin